MLLVLIMLGRFTNLNYVGLAVHVIMQSMELPGYGIGPPLDLLKKKNQNQNLLYVCLILLCDSIKFDMIG